MTDRELARHVGVSHTFVATIRRELAQQGEIKPKVTRCKPSPNPASPTLSHGEAPQGIPPNDGAGWQLTPGGSESPEEDGEDKESAATEETAVPPGPPRPVPDPRLDDRIQDKVGNVVPRKAEEAFRRAHRIAKCKAALSQLKGQVKQLCEDPHVGVALHWPTIRTDLDNVIAALRFGEPYALCPYCHAKGCKVCHGEGWVGKFTYRQAPKDKE